MNNLQGIIKKLSPYLKSKGFLRSGRNFYYIKNDIAFCIALDAPKELLYVTAYIMPLYIPCDNRYYTYGNRLNTLKSSPLPILKMSSDAKITDAWCETFFQYIEEIIIPFYNDINSPNKLIEYVEQKAHKSSYSFGFSSPEVFIERLKMYTHMYLNNFAEAKIAIESYNNLLMASTFLTVAVRQKYLKEIAQIEDSIRDNEQEVLFLCKETIEKTKNQLK